MSNVNGPIDRDPDYLARREAQERLAAEQSADPSARRAHELLADGYAERLHMPARPSRATRRG